MLQITPILVAEVMNKLKNQPFDDVHLLMQQLANLRPVPTSTPTPEPSTEGTRS